MNVKNSNFNYRQYYLPNRIFYYLDGSIYTKYVQFKHNIIYKNIYNIKNCILDYNEEKRNFT